MIRFTQQLAARALGQAAVVAPRHAPLYSERPIDRLDESLAFDTGGPPRDTGAAQTPSPAARSHAPVRSHHEEGGWVEATSARPVQDGPREATTPGPERTALQSDMHPQAERPGAEQPLRSAPLTTRVSTPRDLDSRDTQATAAAVTRDAMPATEWRPRPEPFARVAAALPATPRAPEGPGIDPSTPSTMDRGAVQVPAPASTWPRPDALPGAGDRDPAQRPAAAAWPIADRSPSRATSPARHANQAAPSPAAASTGVDAHRAGATRPPGPPAPSPTDAMAGREPDTLHITIGRLEVRMPTPAPATQNRPRVAQEPTPLAQRLARRIGGGTA